MLYIKKVRLDYAIDFAAEELKKYLRMMMPRVLEVEITYEPEAKDGFRLGLLEDFGLPCEVAEPMYDDVVHIDTDTEGGILAGSNPRSVLFAVYRFLKLNGCRFLFPGFDGEYIPMQDIQPQKYHKVADYRERGHALEGDPSAEQVIDFIDWHAKEEMNSFGCYGIHNYMTRYYNHRNNEANRAPEGLDFETADKQWRTRFEYEAKKRGMAVRCGGHSLLPKAIGIDVSKRAEYKSGAREIEDEFKPYLAKLKGERKLKNNDIFFTNLCMSNPVVRQKVIAQVLKNYEVSADKTRVGISLADTQHNHCECENCITKRPSDWLVVMLNELDAELTRRGLDDVKVKFSFYVDTMFAPSVERFNNPSRFSLTFCPISRTYNASIDSFENLPEPIPFEYNAWKAPKSMQEVYALLNEWRKVFPGEISVYEYHFWVHQYRDPGMMSMARRLYEDTRSYKPCGMNGCMQDGSNKSFFPNGFHSHIYNETLMNWDVAYEEELADYYSHLYGEDWKVVRNYLDKITEAFSHKYMCGELSADPEKGPFFNPDRVKPLSEVKGITDEMRKIAEQHMLMPTRPQTIAWRVILRHTEYCAGLAEVMIEKCQGRNIEALERLDQLKLDFGKYDFELERYFDFGMFTHSFTNVIKKLPNIEL